VTPLESWNVTRPVLRTIRTCSRALASVTTAALSLCRSGTPSQRRTPLARLVRASAAASRRSGTDDVCGAEVQLEEAA